MSEDTSPPQGSTTTSVFHFPFDVERLIFEQAAYRDRQTTLQLIVVAKRVAHWIEPLIYHHIPHAKTEQFLGSLANASTAKPLDFYAVHVKSICLSFPYYIPEGNLERVIAKVVTHFANLQNLAVWKLWGGSDPTFHQDVVDAWTQIGVPFRPTRFSCSDIRHLFALGDIPNQPDFETPFWSRLTHLDLLELDGMASWSTWKGLASLPCLTHLLFSEGITAIFPREPYQPAKSFICMMLKECVTLELVLFFCYEDRDSSENPNGGEGSRLLQHVMSSQIDPRCVVLPAPEDHWDDWDAPFLGEAHRWADAEVKVRKQRDALHRGTLLAERDGNGFF